MSTVTVKLLWYTLEDQAIEGELVAWFESQGFDRELAHGIALTGNILPAGTVVETDAIEIRDDICTVWLEKADDGRFEMYTITLGSTVFFQDLGNQGLGCKFAENQDAKFTARRHDAKMRITKLAIDDDALAYGDDGDAMDTDGESEGGRSDSAPGSTATSAGSQ